LKGAVIASAATPDKNTLTTGTLSFSDIHNHSEYSASSFGLSGGVGYQSDKKSGETSKAESEEPRKKAAPGGFSPMLPLMSSGSADSTTRSAVAEGTINITNQAQQKQDIATLSRDTSNTNSVLDKNPDLGEILSRQAELQKAASAAGEAVTRTIGDIADSKRDDALAEAEKAHKAGNEELANKYRAEADQWKEGGEYRAGLHMAGGALVAGLGGGSAIGGAIGAGAASLAAPQLTELADKVASSVGGGVAGQMAGNVVANVAAGAVGSVGGGSGAFMGSNVDRYNRQLHPTEEQKLKELQKGKSPEEQRRLAAAECALVHCADGLPANDAHKAELQKLQDEGQKYTAEQDLLKKYGAFDGYGKADIINDWASRHQVSNRAVGAVQGVTGAVVGAGALGTTCATVVGCALGAAVAVGSFDYSKAGFTQLVNGDLAPTYGEQGLQALGLSPAAAGLTYGALNLGAAAGSVVLANRAAGQAAQAGGKVLPPVETETKAAENSGANVRGGNTPDGTALTGVPINGATRTVPHGFSPEDQFVSAAEDLQNALQRSGIKDATIGVRGSSVTGRSLTKGTPFGPQSDIDFFVESRQLTDGYSTSKNIPGFVHPNKILPDYPLLQDWAESWTKTLGRDVTPGAFVPGTLPKQPSIIVKPVEKAGG
ncbi:hypothetical protein Q3O89_22355, partial [Ralstonia pseudosolanacearum]|nr:hypothetical protein [Ralstonia pseudosolanacearum]